MVKTPSSDTGVLSSQIATHMLIRIGYACQLLLPIGKGNQFLEAYSQAREWKEEYQKPTTIRPGPPELAIRYISNAELAKIRFDDMLGLDKDD